MASNTEIPQTQNREWGFFGTISHHGDAETAWPLAINAISNATSLHAATVQAFLDSRHGRHFADDVSNELSAGKTIADAIAAAEVSREVPVSTTIQPVWPWISVMLDRSNPRNCQMPSRTWNRPWMRFSRAWRHRRPSGHRWWGSARGLHTQNLAHFQHIGIGQVVPGLDIPPALATFQGDSKKGVARFDGVEAGLPRVFCTGQHFHIRDHGSGAVLHRCGCGHTARGTSGGDQHHRQQTCHRRTLPWRTSWLDHRARSQANTLDHEYSHLLRSCCPLRTQLKNSYVGQR